jgi:hypothetical protein
MHQVPIMHHHSHFTNFPHTECYSSSVTNVWITRSVFSTMTATEDLKATKTQYE